MSIKGMNIKAFLANHIEKVALGTIALMLLGIWAKEFFAGNWSREKRVPAEMLTKIDEKRKEIDSSVWPEPMAQPFALVDFSERAQTLLSPINVSRYDLSTELFVPLYKPKEKREPSLMVVEDLRADFGHVILAMRSRRRCSDGYRREHRSGARGDGRRRRRRRIFAAERQSPAGGPIGNLNPGGGGMLKSGRKDRKGRNHAATAAGGNRCEAEARRTEGSGRTTAWEAVPCNPRRAMLSPKVISLSRCGAFGRWKQQIQKFISALHLSSRADAERILDILDFELERQEATAGDDPWSKPWEKLDAQRAVTILDEVDGFDLEPVDMQIVDAAITMSLPRRILGEWKSIVTHPRITNFVLSDEQIEKERQIQEKLNEQIEKLRIEAEKTQGPPKRGFASTVHDYRSIARGINQQRPGESDETWKTLSKEIGNQGGMGRPGAGFSGDDLKFRVTAAGSLMLFRYLDFDVRPGFAYRYRVRLTIRNPNYQKEIVNVVDPSVAEGAERTTPWSKTSNAAVLPVSPKYFLQTVDRQPMYEDGKSSRRGVADIKLYEWHSKLGTRVASVLELTSLGQFLGGEKRVKVLDVGTEVIKEEPYKFSSEDLLLDVESDLTMLPDEHPDLALAASKKETRVGLPSELLVVDRGGEVQVVEQSVSSKEEKALQSRLEQERRRFAEEEKKKDADDNPLNQAGRLGGLKDGGKKGNNPRQKTKGMRGGRKNQ
ncbi:MAG: hypothetical protein U0872_16035 [Planctomycetaceae bacterium]